MAVARRARCAVRRVYQRKMGELIGKMVNALEGGTQRQRCVRAWIILALMVGSMTIARALPDGDESSEVIHAAKNSLGILKQ